MADEGLKTRWAPGATGRMRFYVELKPNETNFVSWKKLVKDSQRAASQLQAASQPSSVQPPVGAHPALEARIAPEAAVPDAIVQKETTSGHQRFSAVIERIERLYKGNCSEDEEIGAYPDDNEYDTEDSFIDDSELNEYFSVDEAKAKHTGFFINRGKLEKVNETPPLSEHAPKKRRRKEMKKMEIKEEIPNKLLKIGPVRLKAAARNAPLVARNIEASDDKIFTAVAHASDTNEIKRQEGNSVNSASGVSTSNQIRTSDFCGKPRQISDKASYHDLDVQRNSFTAPEERRRGVQSGHSNDITVPTRVRAMEGRDENSESYMDGSAHKFLHNKTKALLTPHRDSGFGRPKCTMLEKAFQDLEKGVAELCPPTDMVYSDHNLDVKKRRLPRDVKQKLGKVARLAAKQGKISEEVIERLMQILGHIMRIKTLKRNLKELVDLGISAKKEKEGKLQDMKKEVTEMVQMQVLSLQAQARDGVHHDHSSADAHGVSTSGEKGKWNGSYKWDVATEDRLCDLYEQYVEGMDEHRGPQIKKLYTELAELWPEGMMDKAGIKEAVNRAKERKKRLIKVNNNGGEPSRRRRGPVKSNVADLRNGEWNSNSSFSNNGVISHLKQSVEQAQNEARNERSFLHMPVELRALATVDSRQKFHEKDENRDSFKYSYQQEEAVNRKRKPKMEMGAEDTSSGQLKLSSHTKETHMDKEGHYELTGEKRNNIELNGQPNPELVQID